MSDDLDTTIRSSVNLLGSMCDSFTENIEDDTMMKKGLVANRMDEIDAMKSLFDSIKHQLRKRSNS